MMSTVIRDRLLEQLDSLPDELQHRVLDFAKALALSLPRGVPGANLIEFAGTIPDGDLELMREAIARDCERVDDDW